MASPTALTVTDIDFDNILNNFRNYLKSQDKFKDYNFDGSAITELLKILSYNTFYNAFYVNHIANEMYLDSATERSSVVSRAKSLGYIPASSISSHIYVDLEAHIEKIIGETPPTPSSFISIVKYSTFMTAINDVSYNFITPDLNSLYYDSIKSLNQDYWVYNKANVKIVEGKPLKYSYTVQHEYEPYLIPNDKVDLTSILLQVYPNDTSYSANTYVKVDSMVDGLDGTSEVYWIYEGPDSKHYLQFGNGEFGKKLTIGNVIYIEYIINNGSGGNGAQVFDIGNYQYTSNTVMDKDALLITPSNYTILTLSNISDVFSENNLVRGETSNNTAYVYSFDNNTDVLKLYSSANTFIFNETIHEEYTLGANTIIGSTGIITSTRTETSMSTGGSDLETIDDIKLNAPKLFASQNRLITASDYSSIITHNYPYIKSVSCWGGEEEVPEQLGNVYVSVKPKGRESLDVWEKQYINDNIIEDKKVISMNVHIIDPDYVYIYIDTNIKYSADAASNITEESIILNVKNRILDLNSTTYDNYKTDFYYSAFTTIIDDSNQFILGNETAIQMLKFLTPLLNVPYTANNTATIKFYNPINSANDEIVSQSTTFTCNVNSVTHTDCLFLASGISPNVLTVANSSAVIIANAGTVDYSNGIVYVSNVNIMSTNLRDSSNNQIVKCFANPLNLDLTSSKNCILKIYPELEITTTRVRIKK